MARRPMLLLATLVTVLLGCEDKPSLPVSRGWVPVESGTENELTSISFVDSHHGCVCGDLGTVLETQDGGRTWTPLETGTDTWLSSVWFLSDSTGYVGGDDGLILKTENGGRDWSVGGIDTRFQLRSIMFPTPDTGFAVAFYRHLNTWFGYLVDTHDGGSTWNTSPLPGYGYRPSVFFSEARVGFLPVGPPAAALRTVDGGDSWQTTSMDTDSLGSETALLGITFPEPEIGYAVGLHGLVVKSADAGSTWSRLESPAQLPLVSVHFRTPLEGFVAGERGIGHTEDGGVTWTWTPFPEVSLNAVEALPDGHALAVGEGGVILRLQ